MKKLIALTAFICLAFAGFGQTSFANMNFLHQGAPVIDCHQTAKNYTIATATVNTANTDSSYYLTEDTGSASPKSGDSIMFGLTTITAGLVGLQMGLVVTDNSHDSLYVFVNRSKHPAYAGLVSRGANHVYIQYQTFNYGTPTHICAYTTLAAGAGAVKERWYFTYVQY